MNSSLPDLLDCKTKTILPAIIGSFSIEPTLNTHSSFTQDDAMRIFQNKTIVFFGEGPIRSIYCDLSKLLHNSKILSSAEIKKHHNHHAPYISK